MTTSGTTSFNLVANQIIDEAYDLCGIGSEGEPVTADMYARGMRSLNLLVKSFGASDHLWTRTERTLAPIAGQSSYGLTPKPMRVLSVRATIAGVDTPLTPMIREEYNDQPSKAASSTPPTAYYYDPQTTTGTLYLWPTPDASVAASCTLDITYLRRMEDFTASNNDADLPQEWLQTLTYALASELALKFGVAADIRKEISDRFTGLMALMTKWDAEGDSVFVQVPLIAEAYELIGITNITAEKYARALRSLNLLISTWSAQPHLWTQTEGSLALVAAQAPYVLPQKAQRVLSVRRKNTSGQIDVPLNELSRIDYEETPNKLTQSTPVSFYYDPQVLTGTMYLWPTPSASVASQFSIAYTYLRPMVAFNGTTLDMPAEWQEAVAYNLAARLKLKYPLQDKNSDAHVDAMASKLFADLKGWDNEPSSIFLQPDDGYYGYGRC